MLSVDSKFDPRRLPGPRLWRATGTCVAITFWPRDTPRMILHNPYVFYSQRTDPMDAGRRPLDFHTNFDRAKRLGSGNQTSIPPFLLVFLCSA